MWSSHNSIIYSGQQGKFYRPHQGHYSTSRLYRYSFCRNYCSIIEFLQNFEVLCRQRQSSSPNYVMCYVGVGTQVTRPFFKNDGSLQQLQSPKTLRRRHPHAHALSAVCARPLRLQKQFMRVKVQRGFSAWMMAELEVVVPGRLGLCCKKSIGFEI